MQQRPSLFNYATAYFKNRPYDLCQSIAAHPDVQESGNPLFSEEAPLPVPGTDGALALDYCACKSRRCPLWAPCYNEKKGIDQVNGSSSPPAATMYRFMELLWNGAGFYPYSALPVYLRCSDR